MPAFLANIAFYIVPFLLVVGVVVTVHEFGHFLAGKAVGAKIDQFSIGFGKAIAQWTDKSGVQWRIGWLPIGGFVRFAGDDNAASVPDRDDLDALRREVLAREGPAALAGYHQFKPIWQRAFISAAGPLANFLLAIVIFAVILMTVGEPVAPARIETVMPGGAAAAAGFQPGDVIVKVDGRKIRFSETVRRMIIMRAGVPITFVVDRGGQPVTLVATPVRGPMTDDFGRVHQVGQLKVAFKQQPGEFHFERHGPISALIGGAAQTRDLIGETIFYLGRLVTGQETADQISGPIGMAQVSGDIAKQTAKESPNLATLAANGALRAIYLVATISVGIGFLNLLPIPVLDGGHLLFYAYEAVARRPLAAKVQAAGYRVGLALVLGLMLFATWNDLQRLRVFNFIGRLFS